MTTFRQRPLKEKILHWSENPRSENFPVICDDKKV